MTTKRLVTLLVALPAVVLFAACSGTSNTPDGGTQDAGTQDAGTQDAGTDGGTGCVTTSPWNITGTVAVHPVSVAIATAGGTTVNLDNTTLGIARASALLNPNNTNPWVTYSDAACTPVVGDLTPDATTNGATAPIDYQNVNLDNVALGVIGVVDNAAGSTTFINSATGLAAPPFTKDVTGVHAFAVTAATEAALAHLQGKSPGDLTTAGFLLGTFVDKNDQPIAGVTLVQLDASGNASAVPNVFYPDATFTGANTTANTSANGVFVVSQVNLLNLSGQKTGMTFTSQQAATIPHSCFVMFLVGS